MPQHIKRLIGAFVIFIVFFLVIRQILKPSSFGELGHYRAKAIVENEMKPLHYAGTENCSKCHDEIRSDKNDGFHAQLKCEVCHGPGLKHALNADKFKAGHLPDSLKLFKPTERKNCAVCHQKNAARIKMQPDSVDKSMVKQVDVMKHHLLDEKTNKEYKCIECHNPHLP